MTRYEDLKQAFSQAIKEVGLVSFKTISMFLRNWGAHVK